MATLSLNRYRQYITFAAIGAVGTLCHYAVLIYLVQSQALSATIASSIAFVVGSIVNFILNYRYNFTSNRSMINLYIRFFTVAISGFLINLLVMYSGINWTDLHYIIVQIVATGITLQTNFFLAKYWAFSNSSRTIK